MKTYTKKINLFTIAISILIACLLLNQCQPAHADTDYQYERWQNALESERNGSVLSAEEIMQLHYCNDLHIRTGRECVEYTRPNPYFVDRYSSY